MGKEKINMLETIFEAREEDLAFIDEKDKKFSCFFDFVVFLFRR